jgi:hypothetical protein
MPYAWIEDNRVRDVALGNPSEIYHPDIAVFYNVILPDGTINGATLIDGVWTNPEPIQPSSPPPIQKPMLSQKLIFTPPEFMLLFEPEEFHAIEMAAAYTGDEPQSSTLKIKVSFWLRILNDPRLTEVNLNLPTMRNAIRFLGLSGILAPERVIQILGPEPTPEIGVSVL